jgi:hypothetical protein
VFDNPYDFYISDIDNDGGPTREVVYKFKDKDTNSYVAKFSSIYISREKKWFTDFDYKIERGGFVMSNLYDVRVLSTVSSIFKDFITKFQPNSVEYLGVKEEKTEKGDEDDPNFVSKRAKINQLIVNKFKSDFPDYKVSFSGSKGVITRKSPRVMPTSGNKSDLEYHNYFAPPADKFSQAAKSNLSDYDA